MLRTKMLVLLLVAGTASISAAQATDPLADAEAIVKAAGAVPAGLKPVQVLATHELLMEPTAWYHHRFEAGQPVGESGNRNVSSAFEIMVLYPDETFAHYSHLSSYFGTYDDTTAHPGYFLSQNELRVPLSTSGKWKVDDSGKIEFTVERISNDQKKRRDFNREDYVSGWRRHRPFYYTAESLRHTKDKPSTYDLKRATFYPRHFGSTASKAQGASRLEPL